MRSLQKGAKLSKIRTLSESRFQKSLDEGLKYAKGLKADVKVERHILKLKETIIQRQIMDYLRAKGVFFFRVNTGGIMRGGKWCPSPNTTKGVSDIVAIKHFYETYPSDEWIGQFCAIEVKRPGGKLSPDQKAFLANVEKAGGLAIVAYSVEDVRKVFG